MKLNLNYKIFFFYINILFFIFFPIKDKRIIDIDNQLSEYESNINFSNFSTDIKAIALYLPQFHSIKENDIWWGKGFTEWTNVKKCRPKFKGHHQPRIPGDKINYLDYYKLTNASIIKKQVELAKSHGIYGFAIYYYWFSGKKLLEKPLNIYLNDKSIDFHFLLIWVNENWTRKWDGKDEEILIKQEYKNEDPELFINDIKKYLVDYRYIKINNKPVLGLYEPFKIPNLNETIKIWRMKLKEFGIGEIFILVCINGNKIDEIQKLELFDGAYDFPPRNLLGDLKVKYKNTFIYNGLIYNNFTFNNINENNFKIFRGSMLEWDNCPRVKECSIFDYYSPEQFYILNKMIIKWTRKHYNRDNRFIFINAWNEWGEGSYLEPDEKYGYASINSLSKALFNLTYIKIDNIINLNESTKILIQVHLFYEDLFKEIINITNNIPVKYDLFISVNSKKNKKKIEKYITNNSKANLFEIKVLPNKGRDVLPLIIQIKKIIKKYKYFCHIHSKKSFHVNFGERWREYLFNNLLGTNEIISEILADFENYDNLGFIYPEPYYEILNIYGKIIFDPNYDCMKCIINKIFPNVIISQNYFDFPEGNMFWARINAVYQIFELKIENKFPIENGKLDCTLMHCIERIWIYLVKLNGYNYKKIFKWGLGIGDWGLGIGDWEVGPTRSSRTSVRSPQISNAHNR